MEREASRDILLRHARTPVCRGNLAAANRQFVLQNPVCGDRVHWSVLTSDGMVKEIMHETTGCIICQASSSLLAESVRGRDQVNALQVIEMFCQCMREAPDSPWPADLATVQALSELRQGRSRLNCALLPWLALHRALADETV